MKHIFIALIKFYQRVISPAKAPCCRFMPTCSGYAVEALLRHGAIKGLGLTAWRILRCNPACKGGYDPVPVKKDRKRKRVNVVKDILYLSDKAFGRK